MTPFLARLVASLVAIALTACGLLPKPPVAPAECGFPDNAALIFGGRSTTATLGVQEIVGDALSNDPADIYITRDEIDTFAGHGRHVCAIYVGQNFVEVTMAPEGWDLGAGRPPDTAAAEPSEPQPAPQPDNGLARDDAIAAARAAVPEVADLEVGYAFFAPATEVLTLFEPWAEAIPPDRWLWRVDFVSGSSTGTSVYLDFVDGTVYGSYGWIE